MVSYSPFEALAVQYLPSGEEVVLLQSLDTDLFPHQVRIDGTIFDLPGLPFQYFAVDTAGLQIAIPQPGTLDAVYLLQEEVEEPMSWQSVILDQKVLDWKVFPNPVTDQLDVVWQGESLPAGPVTWYLRDAQGRLLATQALAISSTVIRSEDWAPGWYTYEIRQHGRIVQTGPLVFR